MYSLLRFFFVLRILTVLGRKRPFSLVFSFAVFCVLIYSIVR
jgi:hypothetical protein